ncbi:Bacterial mobilisation protein (MobC) [Dorea longicatena]|uniref:Bacterial mobilisation protein (MobC) n=1 Tax=Dorea longicatena TaxID=88431 RepID=A0A564TU94_9FIRM|nr:plasmid mobilization relaxosome protein MobC [Dorea longicatena]VUX10838.1 Bacterial mobilisation protein (MobC) [Dorea longicatena]
MKTIGRNKENKRTHIICLRLTDIELSVLENRAEKCRMTRSDFIRNLILNRKLTPKYQIVVDGEEVRSLLAQYGKIGSNLNQIARHFNSGGERSLAMQEEIQQAIAELYALRKEVLRLAGDYTGSPQTHKKP